MKTKTQFMIRVLGLSRLTGQHDWGVCRVSDFQEGATGAVAAVEEATSAAAAGTEVAMTGVTAGAAAAEAPCAAAAMAEAETPDPMAVGSLIIAGFRP